MFTKKRTILSKQSWAALSKQSRKIIHREKSLAMFAKCSFDEAENKLDYHRGRNCIEKLCKMLKEHAMKIINYEEKKWYY